MRLKVIVCILIVFKSFFVFSKDQVFVPDPANLLFSGSQPVINASDSIIFDLASATITASYIDIPLYIKSDDVIHSFDYAIQFNLSKLTYSTTIDLLPSDPTVVSGAYFNPSDLFLRYTSSSFQGYPNSGSTFVTKIRFMLGAPCVSISTADFSNILTILNGTQCSFRMTNLNFIQFMPAAGFNTGPTCLNTGIQFADASSVGSGTILAWQWSFSNGSSASTQSATTIYTATGASSATLIVTTGIGCKDTIIKSLTINVLPLSSFSHSFSCVADSVFFVNASTIPSGSIAGSSWSFGETGGSSNLINPSYHYNASGIYTVTLISTSDLSCTATSTAVVNLTNKVSAAFNTSANNGCLGSTTSFSDVSTYSLNVISSWAWNFGDGSTSSQQNPSYTYATPGTYSVTLTSTSSDGCKGFITRTITVNALPDVQFAVNTSTTCAAATATFSDLSSAPVGSTYFWSFGNGSTSTVQNPVSSYSVAGNYEVKLVITSTVGCADSLTKSYTASLPPRAEAPFSETVLSNAVVSFTNLTTGSVKVSWNFGDNQTSLVNQPLHTFPAVGTYKVCLLAYDASDCIATSCKDVFVGLSRVIAVPSAFTPNRDDVNDVLKVKGGPVLEMEFMIFNQWGNLVFSSNSQDLGWDGTLNGEAQPVGAYEYILRGKTSENKNISLYGVVNLTR